MSQVDRTGPHPWRQSKTLSSVFRRFVVVLSPLFCSAGRRFVRLLCTFVEPVTIVRLVSALQLWRSGLSLTTASLPTSFALFRQVVIWGMSASALTSSNQPRLDLSIQWRHGLSVIPAGPQYPKAKIIPQGNRHYVAALHCAPWSFLSGKYVSSPEVRSVSLSLLSRLAWFDRPRLLAPLC